MKSRKKGRRPWRQLVKIWGDIIKKLVILYGIILLLLSGCEIEQSHGTKTKSNNNNQQIREDVKQKIDELGNYKITEINGLTEGIAKSRKFQPDTPKEFSAGMFKVLFKNGNDEKIIILQTELKVDHLSIVIPGKTKVDGYISYYESDEYINENYIGLMFNKKEQEYFINILYKKFNIPLDEEDAKNLNKVKDYALAIYFNGEPGIKEYHNKHK